MTDFEINKLVAEKLGLKVLFSHSGLGRIYLDNENRDNVDYCNNPSHAWPIILENGISINAPDYLTDPENGHGASTFDSPMVRDKNPLRAAMIVYLMMGDNDE